MHHFLIDLLTDVLLNVFYYLVIIIYPLLNFVAKLVVLMLIYYYILISDNHMWPKIRLVYDGHRRFIYFLFLQKCPNTNIFGWATFHPPTFHPCIFIRWWNVSHYANCWTFHPPNYYWYAMAHIMPILKLLITVSDEMSQIRQIRVYFISSNYRYIP